MTSKNILGVEDVEVKSDSEETSNEDLESLLLLSSDEDEFKNEFVDERLEVVTRARSLIMYWHQLHQQLSQVREGYSLAKLWEDDDLKGQHMEQGRPLIKTIPHDYTVFGYVVNLYRITYLVFYEVANDYRIIPSIS